MQREVFARMEELDQEHWWFVARRKIVRGLLARHAPAKRDRRVLEVGCGTGSNLAMLKEFGRVDAIEPDSEARAVARRRSGVSVEEGYLPCRVDLENGAYDIIVLLDVLEHIDDDVAALQALSAKLAEGGRLMLTVPALPWLWGEHDVSHHHHRRYTRQTLQAALHSSGFDICHYSYFNTLLFPLIVAFRAVSKLIRSRPDDRMPSRGMNWLLCKTFATERHWVSRLSVPFGVSLAAVAQPIER